MQQKKINSLQGLRCFAALMVCSMHMISDKQPSDSWIIHLQHIFGAIGYFGVDLFFTISGFIMAWIVMREASLPSFRQAIDFMIKRIFRIYPLYWFTMIFMVFLSIYSNQFVNMEVKQALHFVVIFLLTPSIPLQYAAWTLPFELYFYSVVFCFICFCKKKYFLLFFALWALIHFLIIEATSYHLLSIHCPFITNCIIFEFFFGLLVAYFLDRFKNDYSIDKYCSIIIGTLIFIVGTAVIYRYTSKNISPWIMLFFHGIPAALFVYGFVGLDQQGRLKTPTIIKGLGDISYSIYLWHFPVLGIATFFGKHTSFYYHIYPITRIMIEMAVVIGISCISYRYIEYPFIYFSKIITKKISLF